MREMRRMTVRRDSVLNINKLSNDKLTELRKRIFMNHDATSASAEFESFLAGNEHKIAG